MKSIPKKTKLDSVKSDIKRKEVPENAITFSFKHLDSSNKKFSIKDKDWNYFHKVFDRFKSISDWTQKRLVTNYTNALRCHPIEWKETTERRGFHHLSDEILEGTQPYQISISSNEHGRVHGFFISNVFYVIWFDPHHALYS
jgi:hypothetical protein